MPRRRPVRDSSAGSASVTTAYRAGFERYLKSEVRASANTVTAYLHDVDVFLAHLRETGGPAVTTLTLQTLTGYVRNLSESGLAETTVARHVVSVKMFLRYLQLEGVVESNAADLLSSPKLWRHLPTVLSPDNVERLLTEPNGGDAHFRRDRAILSTMYACGARASEVGDLTVHSVNLEARSVRLFGKGRKERLVSLTPRAVGDIRAYLEQERGSLVRNPTDRLFLSRSGRPLSRIAVWDLIKKYAARIGCGDSVSPHTLRHSFATHMLAGGAEIRALQELLGHASIRTTQVYTHVDSSRMKSIHASCHPRG